jgi:hypothetical protein
VTATLRGADARDASLERWLLDRDAVESATLRLLRPRARNRPDLRLLEWRGERVVAKDWRGASLLLRPHARRCLAREWRALEALVGLPGVPRPIARVDGVIVVSHVAGALLAHGRPPHARREAFFAALAACVERIHARGVVHLDLRQRRNILCDADGQPGVLDFEAALLFDPTRAFGRLALHWGCKLDRLALLKHKARYAPSLLASRERRLVRAASVTRWLWPSTLLHRARVALRRLARRGRRRGGS